MIDGIKIDINGRIFVAPPANLGAIRRFLEAQENLAQGSAEYMGAMIAFVHRTLRRNYPELTQDEVEDILDGRNVKQVVDAIQKAAGLELGEAVGKPSTGT